jgi:two-component system, OmpR family, sensor histidine kinase ChvG
MRPPPSPPVPLTAKGLLWQRVRRGVSRIGVRLLLVNALALLVPIVGLEFARIHERQLLEALERDMKNQAVLVRAMVEAEVARGGTLAEPAFADILTDAARSTRTRIRILDERGAVLADSHENGPPEGPEPPPPRILGRVSQGRNEVPITQLQRDPSDPRAWPEIADRVEVRAALAGIPASRTRVRERAPGVFLFVAEPLRDAAGDRMLGAVYAVRSTRPVMVELYRIRAGLIRVLFVASCFTALVTLLFAWSISRPLGKLSRAAKRVAAGERDVVIPVGGGGEIEELGESFAAMKDRLDARLRYIEGFAADVAHEFKSPLTSIRGAAELLGEGAADEPEARARFLRNIELDVARLDRLVSRLLQLSRIEASSERAAPVDLPALIERAIARAALPDRPIELHVRSLPDTGPVSTTTARLPAPVLRGREADLDTAVQNLLENAVRFSPPGVPVEVGVTFAPAWVVVAVRDRGPGISQAHMPRIFDRFFTTDAERDGTGLGLAIVKTVIEAHGGSIRAESPPREGGEGTTFTLTLPLRRRALPRL